MLSEVVAEASSWVKVSMLPSLSLNHAALPTGVVAMPSTVRRPGWSYSSKPQPGRTAPRPCLPDPRPPRPRPGAGRSRRLGRKQQEQAVLAVAVQQRLRLLLGGGEPELVAYQARARARSLAGIVGSRCGPSTMLSSSGHLGAMPIRLRSPAEITRGKLCENRLPGGLAGEGQSRVRLASAASRVMVAIIQNSVFRPM